MNSKLNKKDIEMKDRRVHKFKADYGIGDYKKFYEKKYNKELKDYSKIISEFNKEVINLILNDNLSYTIPFLFFEITIRKEKRFTRIDDGKLINHNPINWKATKELWEKDEDARERKIRVRHNNYNTSGYIFRIYLKKFKCRLKNRSYYKIKPNRNFQRALAKRINDPNKEHFDSFLLYKH